MVNTQRPYFGTVIDARGKWPGRAHTRGRQKERNETKRRKQFAKPVKRNWRQTAANQMVCLFGQQQINPTIERASVRPLVFPLVHVHLIDNWRPSRHLPPFSALTRAPNAVSWRSEKTKSTGTHANERTGPLNARGVHNLWWENFETVNIFGLFQKLTRIFCAFDYVTLTGKRYHFSKLKRGICEFYERHFLKKRKEKWK